MKWVHVVAYLLVMVGALNWGLVGLFGFNLVSSLVSSATLEKWIYVLVGLSALYVAYSHLVQKDCKVCSAK